MKTTLTLQEACIELGIDQSTLYRWMIRAHMQPSYDAVDHRKRVLSRSQVNELARVHGCVLYGTSDSEALQLLDKRLASVEDILARNESKSYDELAARIKAVETNYSALSDRLRVIEGMLRERPSTITPARPVYAVSETPSDIPTGSMLASIFAKQHGIAEATMRGHTTKGHVPCIERPKPGRPHEIERWLSPAHQAEAIRYWRENSTRFNECDACPHDIET